MKAKTIQALAQKGRKLAFPLVSIVLALAISAIIIQLIGCDTLLALRCLLEGGFGGLNAISETLVKATSLIFMALSFAFAQRSGMYNLGGMGQFYIGAIFGGWVGINLTLPAALHIPIMLLCGFVGGALFALLPAILRIRLGANELISTIMFNSVATQILSMFVSGPMKDPNSVNGASQSCLMQDSVKLPTLFSGVRLHLGFLLALAALVIFWFFYARCTRGFEVRVVGMNPQVAQYAGMNIRGNQLVAMLIGGGLAGIGGCIELMSVQSRLVQGFSASLSFQGISVALLGDCTPVGIFLSSVLYGALNAGSGRMQMLAKVPASALEITQSLIILFLAGREIFRYVDRQKLRGVLLRGKRKEASHV